VMALLSDATSASKAEELCHGILELLSYLDLQRTGAEWIANYARVRERADSVLSETERKAAEDVWPSGHDVYLEGCVTAFVNGRLNDGGSASRLCSAVLLMLFLRFARKLRGVRPSQLFERAALGAFVQYSGGEGWGDEAGEAAAGPSDERLEAPRREFLKQCIEQSKTTAESWFVYKLGGLWKVSESAVQCMHYTVLVDRGADSEVLAAIKVQRGEDARPFASIVEALRKRVGNALARVDGAPAYMPLLSTVDKDFIHWAISAAEPVDEAILQAVRKKMTPAVEIDVASSTQLVKALAALMLKHESDHEIERFGTLAKRCEVLRILLTKLARIAALP